MFEAMECCQSMYLEIFKICILEYTNLFQVVILLHQDRSKKREVKLEQLTDIDILLIEKGIRSGTCHAICWYEKADKITWKVWNNEESSYLK